ncbi:MAG: hypothetical protein KJO31_04705 [Gammaproteobacteria bacterium]|nr:hypothetical protein [Gammaproteobacteria bacterium]
MRIILAAIAVLVFSPAVVAGELPLFASQETLHLTLEFPVNTLLRQRDERPVLDGVLRYTDDSGQELALDMSMTTRGKSRLEYCSFPPLTLDLKRKQLEGSVFEGQNKLKIVTHCKNGSQHLRYLHQELGIYRAFNVISEFSYRVRPLRITYSDTDGKRGADEHDAFFIESHDEVASRHGMERSRIPQLEVMQLDAAQATLYSVFQYMIANTDWSMIKGPGEEGCCHNGKVIMEPGTQDGWIVLPYDFDQAGLINTRYSAPAEALRLKSVRQRLYRGRCLHNDQLPATVDLFNRKRSEIEEAIIPEGLNKRTKRSSLKYIDDFYKIINDPKQLEKKVLSACLG